MSASAGRVLLLFKGAYDSTVTYQRLDVVTYASGSYVCKQTSLNHLPTDTTYWQNMIDVADMTGASAGAAGLRGLVPAPSAGDQNKVLHGDATWKEISLPSDMTGATSGAAGTHGLVPAPSAGDQAKFLRGDATWAELDLSAKADQSVIGGSFNANTAYTPGDRFTHNGKRYKLTITSGTVQGQTPPNPLYYEECSVDDDIESLNSSIIHSSDIYPAVGTELQIGLWGNDPIYRQVFAGQLASSSGLMVVHQLPTYIKLIDLRFILRRSYNESKWEGLCPIFAGEDTSKITTAYINDDYIIIKNFISDYFNRYYTIIIDYCKNYGGTSINP